MEFTEHILERYAERIQEKTKKNEIKQFVAQNRDRIKSNIQKLFDSADFLCQTKIKDHNVTNFYVNKNGWVLISDKDNKKLMKKVEDNISWVMQIFEYPPMIRKLIYTTNAIESLNAGLRKVTKGKGSFINETALMKVLYLRIQNLKKKWSKQIQSWKQVQNELYGIFEERFIQYIEK